MMTFWRNRQIKWLYNEIELSKFCMEDLNTVFKKYLFILATVNWNRLNKEHYSMIFNSLVYFEGKEFSIFHVYFLVLKFDEITSWKAWRFIERIIEKIPEKHTSTNKQKCYQAYKHISNLLNKYHSNFSDWKLSCMINVGIYIRQYIQDRDYFPSILQPNVLARLESINHEIYNITNKTSQPIQFD